MSMAFSDLFSRTFIDWLTDWLIQLGVEWRTHIRRRNVLCYWAVSPGLIFIFTKLPRLLLNLQSIFFSLLSGSCDYCRAFFFSGLGSHLLYIISVLLMHNMSYMSLLSMCILFIWCELYKRDLFAFVAVYFEIVQDKQTFHWLDNKTNSCA